MAEAESADVPKDTLPKRGRVNEVCREWLVKEDGALAYRLQTEEIEHHYTGNKCRNAQVRQDIPHARDQQVREEEEAAVLYARQVLEQEERDARIAKQLADRIEREERLRKQALELQDADIARRMQERERQHVERRDVERRERERPDAATPSPTSPQPAYNHDINNVGLPLAGDAGKPALALHLSQQVRQMSLRDGSGRGPRDERGHGGGGHSANDAVPDEMEARRIQEEQDAEFARLLQEEESGDNEAAMLDQDRLMAIEAQDKELARLLQERERAKAKRARERSKQKALLKKQQEEGLVPTQPPGWPEQDLDRDGRPIRDQEQQPHRAVRPTDLDLSGARGKHLPVDLEAIEVLDSTGSGVTNIAMAIDPTYPRRPTTASYSYASPDIQPSNLSSPALSLPPPDFDEDIPPYMPIQGQRRMATLEDKGKKVKTKKEGKDTCKQQ